MNKGQLISLVLLLGSAAVLATSGLIRSIDQTRSLPVADREEPTHHEKPIMSRPVRPAPGRGAAASSEGLWRKNLFTPSRGPRAEEPKDEQEEAPTQPAQMELTAIGRVGDKQAAVILVSASMQRRRPGRDQRTEPAQPAKKLYMVGEKVGETDYALTEIHFDKRQGVCEVVLTDSAGRTKILGMERDDQASQARAASAAVAPDAGSGGVLTAAAGEVAGRARAGGARTGAPPPPPGSPPSSPTSDTNNSPNVFRGGSTNQFVATVTTTRTSSPGSTQTSVFTSAPARPGRSEQPVAIEETGDISPNYVLGRVDQEGKGFSVGSDRQLDRSVPDKPLDEMTKEERLRWAIEMRRRAMAKRNEGEDEE